MAEREQDRPVQPQKEQKPASRTGWQSEVYSELKVLVSILTVTILIFHFMTQLVVVVGESMYPTLHDGDLMLAWRLNYTPQTGDVVIIHKETELYDGTIVKRVIATGGQTVELDYNANAVYVNGVALDEPYINLEEEDPMLAKGDVLRVEVPEGSVFVMGDNRNHSSDSRDTEFLGTVDEGYIIGKALLVFFPLNHIQTLR